MDGCLISYIGKLLMDCFVSHNVVDVKILLRFETYYRREFFPILRDRSDSNRILF
jgi:hypothetical protein